MASEILISDETIAALNQVSTATVSTQLFRRGLRNAYLEGIRRLSASAGRMVGEAFTLRYIPGREDLDVLSVFDDYDHPQRLAVESAPPASVLVMDCRGQTRAASLGHILATRLLIRGIAGVVTDGAVRDSAGIRALRLPVYAAGESATTNLAQHHAVDMQVPIGCAEVPVYPGDIMIGDQDGVVCVPRSMAAEVAQDALRQEQLEEFILSKVEAGSALRGTYPPDADTQREYQKRAQNYY
jgi:regulator of RNase E activity RraA